MMLSNYYYQNIDEYYWTFSRTLKDENKDVTPFIEFVLKGIVESLHEIKERITYYIRKFTLRDYYNFLKEKGTINKRQFELMNILLKHYLEFAIKDLAVVTPFNLLYNKLSEKTLSRDVRILLTLNLIKEVDKKKYGINMKVLG